MAFQMAAKKKPKTPPVPPMPGYSVVDLKGVLLYNSEDLLSCMDALRENSKGRVYRNADKAMLAFMSGAGY